MISRLLCSVVSARAQGGQRPISWSNGWWEAKAAITGGLLEQSVSELEPDLSALCVELGEAPEGGGIVSGHCNWHWQRLPLAVYAPVAYAMHKGEGVLGDEIWPILC